MEAPMKRQRLAHRIFKGIAGLGILGVLGVVALLISLRVEHGTEITLPTPSGPFAVGRTLLEWKDDKSLDALAPLAGTRREVLVWIWYPALAQGTVIDDYLPAPLLAADQGQSGALLTLLTRDPSKVLAHSLRNAGVLPQQQPYPVVIMRAGASLEVVNYSALAENLASHGYVVVGIDAPYRTRTVAFSDGRVLRRTPENDAERCFERAGPEQAPCVTKQLNAWTADIGFVLDRLEQLNISDPSGKFIGRLDMSRVGVFGHSFGGAQAAQFCSRDSRCKAGIDVDGSLHGSVIQAGIHTPFMFLLSGNGDFSSRAEVDQIMADIRAVYDRMPMESRLFVQIRGANHFTFSDDGALLKSQLLRRVLRVFGVLGIDGRRQLAVTSYCIHTFFDAYLKGAGASRPKISSPLYPEIRVLE